MTVKPPVPPPLPDELDRLLRRLRMPYVRRAAPEVIATATSQRWEHAEVLRVLLAEEAAGRDHATISMRRRASGLPAGKTFDAWETAASVIPTQTQNALRTLEWVNRAEVLVVCGPSERLSHCPPCPCHWSRVQSRTLRPEFSGLPLSADDLDGWRQIAKHLGLSQQAVWERYENAPGLNKAEKRPEQAAARAWKAGEKVRAYHPRLTPIWPLPTSFATSRTRDGIPL
jgi:hypothetical protein